MTENKNDGGSVLPVLVKKTTKTDENGEEKSYHYGFAGLSIRDFFAAKAMQSLIAVYINTGNETPGREYIASWAYEYADEMLKARDE